MSDCLLSPKDRLLRINEAIRHWLDDIEDNGRKIALALKEVHNEGLYLLTHKSFGAYYQDVFKKHQSLGYRLLNWARLSTIVENEAQARVLVESGASPDVQSEALEAAGGIKNATAAKIREALERNEIERQRKKEEKAASQRMAAPPIDTRLPKIRRHFQAILDTLDGSLDMVFADWCEGVCKDALDRIEALAA